MNENQLTALKLSLPAYPHIKDVPAASLSVETWSNSGKPYVWCKVEEKGDYVAFRDSGYGQMAVFKGDCLLGWGRESIVTDEVVMLDKDYYSAAKWLWF